MTGTLHRWTVTVATIATGIGAFFISADTVPFGLDAKDWGLSLVWIGTVANIIATAIRADAIPGVTTGVGSEK